MLGCMYPGSTFRVGGRMDMRGYGFLVWLFLLIFCIYLLTFCMYVILASWPRNCSKYTLYLQDIIPIHIRDVPASYLVEL